MTKEDHYATHIIHEWFANNKGLHLKWSRKGRLYTNVSFLGQDIKAFVYGIAPELEYPFNEILDGELSMVDWIEIAEEFMPDGNDKHGGTTE